MSAATGDLAAASVFVAVSIEAAFEIFTGEIDLWWRRGARFRRAGSPAGRLVLEPHLGGRLLEIASSPAGARELEVGSVIAWEPPRHLALAWRNANFAPHEQTRVDVTFTPSGAGTMVRVEHRGWSALRDDHPARHGLLGAPFARMIGMWWGDLLSSLREHVARRGPSDA